MVAQQKRRYASMRQRMFVMHYVGSGRFNGAAAARAASYSPHCSRQIAWELLATPEIRAEIDELLTAVGVTPTMILYELSQVAKAPMTHFLQIVRPEVWDGAGNVVSPMIARLDLSAKLKALELLGKHHRLFTDVVERGQQWETIIRQVA